MKKFLKDWMLVIGMVGGASLYLIYHAIPAIHPAGPVLEMIIKKVQPALLFAMLFLTFSKIEPKDLRPQWWQLWLLMIQGGTFAACVALILLFPEIPHRVGLEAFMLCMICPTATACAVVTGKLGGNMAGVVTYTILINLLVSIMAPLLLPLIGEIEGLTFYAAFLRILSKVFPLLIVPCLLAWLVRYTMPKLHAFFVKNAGVSFEIWALSLTLAILMSTRAFVRNEDAGILLVDIGIASFISCILQFLLGKLIGTPYGDRIAAGQALGQKNTVFAIWLAYTFMNPIVSIAGGFYSIWHNLFNSWQLSRVRKTE